MSLSITFRLAQRAIDGKISGSSRHTFRNSAGVLEEKDVQLTEEDEIWKETRHMHMKDALDKLIADFQKYAGEYEQKYGGENRGINDMKDMLASLDATRKNKDSLSAHLSLAEKCMAYFEKQKLPLVADVEQVSMPSTSRRYFNESELTSTPSHRKGMLDGSHARGQDASDLGRRHGAVARRQSAQVRCPDLHACYPDSF